MDAEKERGRVSKIRPRLPVRLHESYNSSRVTGGRRWTVRPGSGLQKSARASRAAPVRTWNQGQGSDWSVRGGIDTGPLVGDVQCSIWPMTPVEPSAPPVSVTRVGRVMALRKRNQTQQAEKNQNFKYHFHIPLSHTTAEINQKVVYTTQIPVNHQHCRGEGATRVVPSPRR